MSLSGEADKAPTSASENPWRRISSREIYDNHWISVREDEVIRPNDRPGIYGVVEFKNWAIGIVPVTDDGDTFLVGQYRYTLNQYSWEIPEGGGPKAVSPLESARRELREETGIQAARWTYLGEIHTSNSVTDEVGFIFLTQGLRFGSSNPDETEKLEVRRLPLEEAVRMALSGEISDSLAVAGLTRAWHYLKGDLPFEPVMRNYPSAGPLSEI